MATVYVCEDDPAPAAPGSCVTWSAQTYEPSPFLLDVPAALSLGGSILLLWAVAWGIRQLAHSLRSS